jgi:hypothetical protein
MLLSKARVEDIVGNKIPQEMFNGEARLEQLCGRTVKERLIHAGFRVSSDADCDSHATTYRRP